MKFVEKIIELKSFNDSFTLIPWCCAHWESDEAHKELFHTFTERASESNVYTIGLGDYFDFARSRYRAGLRSVRPDSTSSRAIDASVHKITESFLTKYHGLFGSRNLGLLEGNHFWEIVSTDVSRDILCGETQAMWIARQTSVQYLEELAVITLYITFKNRPGVKDTYVIYTSHGTKTGGSTVGTDIGNMERKIEPMMEADCYITGHTHRRISYFLPKMIPMGKKFIERPHLLIKAGSFLRGFVPNRITYASEAGYRPLDLGWQEIHFNYVERDGKLVRRVSTSMSSEVTIGTLRNRK